MFTIGEFSKITGLTVKTLRFYHEQGLLTPSCVDEQTGYRYYSDAKIETARVITYLRGLDFSLDQIADILRREPDDAELIELLRRQQATINERIRRLKKTAATLYQFIREELEVITNMTPASLEVQEKSVDPMLIAGVRTRGKYAECGRGFSKLGRSCGRHVCGMCFLLHYDMEYREDDADFEACMPIRKAIVADGIDVRELPGGRCVSLMHKGPYDTLGRSYAKILRYAKDRDYQLAIPTREVYLKGPGMIFRGNPKNYLTEIQMLIEESH